MLIKKITFIRTKADIAKSRALKFTKNNKNQHVLCNKRKTVMKRVVLAIERKQINKLR